MSVSRPSLFGSLSFAGDSSSATLFAESFVPQTYAVNLAESMSGTDAELFTSTKVLSETMALTDAQVKTLSRILTDSLTASGAITKTLAKVLADSGSISESQVLFTIKSLTDFLILKEWISIRLTKSIVWTNPEVNANLHDTLWGKYTFGSQLFGGVKPSSTWNAGPTKSPSVWTNSDGYKYNC